MLSAATVATFRC